MNKKRKVIFSIVTVFLIVLVVVTATYAYIVAITNKENVGNSSGMLDINYTEPDDISGALVSSQDRSGGLFTSAKASLTDGSVDAILNMYITPTALTNLNIEALKWEAEGVRDGQTICSGSGNFASAVVGEPIKLFENDLNDSISDCILSTTDTIFEIYIWLDASLINTSLGGASFGATIGADSIDITGMFDGDDAFNKLPNEYQKVEYIESAGTQYIEIDYIASSKTNSKGKFQIIDTSKAGFLFGSRGESGTNFYGLNWGGGLPFKYYNSYYGAVISSVAIDDKIHTFEKNKDKLYLDDNFIIGRTEYEFVTPGNMIIFGCNDNGNKGYLPPYARIYSLKFYDDDTLVVDLIPCYKKSDNVIGMYDLVNGKFYTNLGTGDFLKGSDV